MLKFLKRKFTADYNPLGGWVYASRVYNAIFLLLCGAIVLTKYVSVGFVRQLFGL